MRTQTVGRLVFLFTTLSLVSGCIMTPRVQMTERIDFNYHAPAIIQPLSYTDQMCSA